MFEKLSFLSLYFRQNGLKQDIISLASIVNKAKEYYGLTYNFNEAGYILQDGEMLDFSGKNHGGSKNTRSYDHRNINIVMEGSEPTPTDSMTKFMKDEGAIRFSFFGDYALLDMEQLPTRDQLSTIKIFITTKRPSSIGLSLPNTDDVIFIDNPRYSDILKHLV